ncbi:hypothetical protein EDD21DRAFT_341858 [Dissophora ornata]|nr:hypothetical protein BGZ58_011090 [Dissophora ornata]KAI8597804.1 hypothetical protein EDD21DRAFT_341858 [Dissophora ornata]
MPPIIAEHKDGCMVKACPTIVWSVHVLAPYALVKNLDAEKDDVDNDNSYFVTTLQNGERMATEWNPELRLGIKRAVDTIPNVLRQEWHYIGLESVDQVLDSIIVAEQDHDFEGRPMPNHGSNNINQKLNKSRLRFDDSNILIKAVVLNFTDGMETDGWPGITVIRGLEKRHLAFTGANSTLYYLDSDKALIKRHLIKSNTPTPGYCDVYSRAEKAANPQLSAQENGERDDDESEEEKMVNKAIVLEGLSKLRFPLLVKPANSSSSRGISTKSVVDSPEEAYERAMETKRVWGPVYVEEYITGREYTVLVSGSLETGIRVYKVLERVFRSQIPERERMLTHEMKWGDNNYGTDESVKTASWWMQICSDADQKRLQPMAEDIYASFGGNGYCRMDLREDHRTGQVFVVDVNANCSIDEDEDCAMGKILKASGLTLGQFFSILMEDAILIRDDLLTKTNNNHASGLKSLVAFTMNGMKHADSVSAANVGTVNKAIRVQA